jgi:hypothetical protein
VSLPNALVLSLSRVVAICGCGCILWLECLWLQLFTVWLECLWLERLWLHIVARMLVAASGGGNDEDSVPHFSTACGHEPRGTLFASPDPD